MGARGLGKQAGWAPTVWVASTRAPRDPVFNTQALGTGDPLAIGSVFMVTDRCRQGSMESQCGRLARGSQGLDQRWAHSWGNSAPAGVGKVALFHNVGALLYNDHCNANPPTETHLTAGVTTLIIDQSPRWALFNPGNPQVHLLTDFGDAVDPSPMSLRVNPRIGIEFATNVVWSLAK